MPKRKKINLTVPQKETLIKLVSRGYSTRAKYDRRVLNNLNQKGIIKIAYKQGEIKNISVTSVGKTAAKHI